MKERIRQLCCQGENCSRCILRGAAECYGFALPQELMESLNAISAGFGIGSVCSALVAGVMVLGILFPTDEAKQKSLLFFSLVQEKWHCLDCARLSADREDCRALLGEIADILQEVIAA